MGATRVIAVNASRFIPPPVVGMMIKGMRRWRRPPSFAMPAAGAGVVMITPKDYLGRMLDGAAWRRDNIRRWIEMGEADALAALKG
jgi:hypothetical protein